MDVFIPEEYFIRRRMEKRSKLVPAEASRKPVKEKKSRLPPPFPFRVQGSGWLIPGGIAETVVFTCLSA
ncbi:hypothetical protein GQ457_11G023890 [Hibiscus cannabinus]